LEEDMIEKLPFGNTGHVSTRTLFGAAALSRVDQATADQTLDLLLEHGVNHIDVAASYGDAELRVGAWMPEHRDDFFLATKTGERTYEAARDQIRRSLERLQTSYVDLIQLHNLVDPEQWEVAMGPDGALKAAIEAKEAGLTRFIGVTGHGVIAPSMHIRSLERFPFDSVLAPYDYPMMQNPQYVDDFEALVALCRERNVAIQTIKSITLGPWGEKEHNAATWYEPLRDAKSIELAVHWVLGRPGIFLNSVGDVTILPRVVDAASRFERRPNDSEMEALVEREKMTPFFV
jgi:aryl-alcohol dehydrogenase-like predicted oxidoreductase